MTERYFVCVSEAVNRKQLHVCQVQGWHHDPDQIVVYKMHLQASSSNFLLLLNLFTFFK